MYENLIDVDTLSDLTVRELETKLTDAKLRVETRAAACFEQGRDLTSVEQDDMKRDKAIMKPFVMPSRSESISTVNTLRRWP